MRLNISYEECINHTGMQGLPDDLAAVYNSYRECEQKPLLRRSFLKELCSRYSPGAQYDRLFEALDEIEADPVLLSFSNFLVHDICSTRHRLDMDDYKTLRPTRGMRNTDLYSFLILLACIEPSLKRLEQIGMPKEYYINTPLIEAEKQMKLLKESGDGSVRDFSWYMNYYTCSLFRIKRFIFLPYLFSEPIIVLRHISNGQTQAFFTDRRKIRRDGQINGVNDVIDPLAVSSSFHIHQALLTGTPINPAGFVEQNEITLDLREWEQVLGTGDTMLGVHIPDGPGYTPEMLRESILEAQAFYQRWFPEIHIAGFGSESWLYDPHLSILLGCSGNIPETQRQMFVYPLIDGDSQMKSILLNNAPSIDKAPTNTRLQRLVTDYMRTTGRMTCCGMFILAQDADKIGQNPYGEKAALVNQQKRLMLSSEDLIKI